MAAESHKGLPISEHADASSWRTWLAAHHDDSAGVWLRIAKKGAPRATVTYAEALDSALCFGWIDGQKAGYDERFWLQRFTARGPRSRWSQINRERALELIEAGAMEAPGLAEVTRARADGRWEAAYEPQSAATVPEDFRAALAEDPEAERFFATLTGANRYAFLYRINDAKRSETRAKRIAQFVEMCREGRTFH